MTGMAHAAIYFIVIITGFGDFSTSTRHILQLPAIESFS
jgi:hypothetical protein